MTMPVGAIVAVALGVFAALLVIVFAVGLACERLAQRRRVQVIRTQLSSFLGEDTPERTPVAANLRRSLPPVCPSSVADAVYPEPAPAAVPTRRRLVMADQTDPDDPQRDEDEHVKDVRDRQKSGK